MEPIHLGRRNIGHKFQNTGETKWIGQWIWKGTSWPNLALRRYCEGPMHPNPSLYAFEASCSTGQASVLDGKLLLLRCSSHQFVVGFCSSWAYPQPSFCNGARPESAWPSPSKKIPSTLWGRVAQPTLHPWPPLFVLISKRWWFCAACIYLCHDLSWVGMII